MQEVDGAASMPNLRVDINECLVECWIENERSGACFETPWGTIELAEQAGGGQVIEVKAAAAFDLILHRGPTSFFEHLTPGKHRLLLTVLDRTDVMIE